MKAASEYSVTCAQMKQLEQQTDAAGLSYYQMMENAGTIAANRIVEITMTSPIDDATEGRRHAYMLDRPIRARIYCGKGNNGGDGFVVARLLARQGWQVEVILVDGPPATPDARANYELLQRLALPVRDLEAGECEAKDVETVGSPDVVVDAIYGTGFHGKLREAGAAAAAQIAAARNQGARVFALDIPSGMGGDLTAEEDLDPRCVRADVTITFHARKPVHLQPFADRYCGRILTADIGIVDPERPTSVEGQKRFALDAGETYTFEDFAGIIARLRAPGGCPWDREQTHETLKKYFLEETREALEAIDKRDDANLCEELGDVLLQIVLHAQIGKERDAFTMDDVIQGICEKMIRRHPWVFGDMQVSSPEEGERIWEEIKRQEKAGK